MNGFIFKKFPALKNVDMRRLVFSQLLSQSGGYIQNVALSALITERTQSRLYLGIFLCVSYAPVFLFSCFASKVVLKTSAKRVLVLTEALLLAMSAALIMLSEMPFWGFLIFGAVWGTVRAFQTPTANTMPKLLCSQDTLSSGVSCLSLSMSLSRAAGPIISGLLYTALGYRAAFAANTVTYIPSLILLWKIKTEEHASAQPGKNSGKVKLCIPLLIIVFTVSFIGTGYNIIFTGLCEKLQLPRIWFSVFMALVGLGAAAGAYMMTYKRRYMFFALGISAAAAVLAASESIWMICPAVLFYGLSDYMFFTFALTKIQQENSERSITKAMGVYTIVTAGALPLGFLALGYLTQTFSISTVLSLICACIAFVYIIFYRKIS